MLVNLTLLFYFLGLATEALVLFPKNLDNSNNSDKDNCTCVPMDLCQDEGYPALDGAGQLDIRIFSTAVCSNYYHVCCKNPMDPVDEPKSEIKCGYKYTVPFNKRITTYSDDSEFAEFPWTVVVLRNGDQENDSPIYKCGGSLIHPQVALTAAHCVNNMAKRTLLVRAGEWDTKVTNEPLHHQDVPVEEVVIHEQFNENSLKNDIALLFLDEEFVMLENVGIICLPPMKKNIENIRCLATGWGKDAYDHGKHSSILKKVSLPLVRRNDCQKALRRTRLGPFYTLHESFVCAGGEMKKDTCQGDGGSPLVCPIRGEKEVGRSRYYQMGIVSWGIGCGNSRTPGVYVNVATFADWIDDHMQSRNFDTAFYKF
ncbi:phenoloxidase-activating factor 2-like isoform X2 [Sitophilus oryzae]|uniref:Phenoloxidase-activating factor 2 n=1 Tax=Sitophilus oryzae TaxID=7048 RepID=A0A6J2XX04_SITOR|nr:phenoloxidase-activating factor 2-like isoform X2 [Sitophilus oryzae]